MKGPDDLAEFIRMRIQDETGSKCSKPFAKSLAQSVIEFIFETSLRDGEYNLGRGFGRFKVKTYSARRVPDGSGQRGATKGIPERKLLRYILGKDIRKRLVGTCLAESNVVKSTNGDEKPTEVELI